MTISTLTNDKFTDIYKQLYPCAIRYACKLVGHEDGHDITQESFLRLYKINQTKSVTLIELKAYLLVCIKHAAVRIIYRRGLHQKALREILHRTEFCFIDYKEPSELQTHYIKMLYEMGNKLKPSRRDVFYLAFIHGMKAPQIAEILGISVVAARSRKSELIAQIKNELKSTSR